MRSTDVCGVIKKMFFQAIFSKLFCIHLHTHQREDLELLIHQYQWQRTFAKIFDTKQNIGFIMAQ
jgi:hypothetical protein